jgi:hypothetical protein
MRLRQIAFVARDLEPTLAALTQAFEQGLCYRDPGVKEFGLHNGLLPIGDTFLEVVSPLREGTTAGRLLDRRGGDGGYMVILQTHDLAGDRARVDALGVRVVWQVALPDIASFHMHPRDVGGAIVSLDQPEPAASWRWGGPEWPHMTEGGNASAIVAAELEAERPESMARRWSEVLGLPQLPLGDGRFAIVLQGGELRFVPAGPRGEGLGGIDVQARSGRPRPETTLCGVRIRWV